MAAARKTFKRIYYGTLRSIGYDKVRLSRMRRNSEVAIVNLHRVSTQINPFWPALHVEQFEALLKFLDRNFQVVRLADIDNADGKRPLAVLSFDDGYYDYVEYVMPLLKKYRMSANMNVIPTCVESGKPIWNVQLYDFLGSASLEQIRELPIEGPVGKLTAGTDAAKLRYGLEVSRYLKTMPRDTRLAVWGQIEPYLHRYEMPSTRMMTAADLQESLQLTEVGVHSYSHESMGQESMEFFVDDFEKCKIYFEETLDHPLSIYAFPNGSFRDEQVLWLEDEGIDSILLVDEDLSKRSTKVHKRLTLYGDSDSEVMLRAIGI